MNQTLRSRVVALAAAAVALLYALPLAAQEARDPTVEPAGVVAGEPLPKALEGMSVLVRGNKPFLMVGTRLYAPGDTVGTLRVQRISETEVWLHDGHRLLKVPRFAGITRKTVAAQPPCGVASATPCQDTPP